VFALESRPRRLLRSSCLAALHAHVGVQRLQAWHTLLQRRLGWVERQFARREHSSCMQAVATRSLADPAQELSESNQVLS